MPHASPISFFFIIWIMFVEGKSWKSSLFDLLLSPVPCSVCLSVRLSVSDPQHQILEQSQSIILITINDYISLRYIQGYSKWLSGFQQLVIHNTLEIAVYVSFYLIEQHSKFLLHKSEVLYMCTFCDSTNINTIIEFVPNWQVVKTPTIISNNPVLLLLLLLLL